MTYQVSKAKSQAVGAAFLQRHGFMAGEDGSLNLRPGVLTRSALLVFVGLDLLFKLLVVPASLPLFGIEATEEKARWPLIIASCGLVLGLWSLAFVLLARPIERALAIGLEGLSDEALGRAGQGLHRLPHLTAMVSGVAWVVLFVIIGSAHEGSPSYTAEVFFVSALVMGILPLSHGLVLCVTAPLVRQLSLQATRRGVVLLSPSVALRWRLALYCVFLSLGPAAYMASLAFSVRTHAVSYEHLLGMVLLYFFAAAVFAVICAAVLASAVTGPVREISGIIQDITKQGDVSRVGRVPQHHRDELGALSGWLNEMIDRLEKTTMEHQQMQETLEFLNATLSDQVLERTAALSLANQALEKNIAEVQLMQRDLVEASRKAGMADVATSVLHNVGNVLNSVNVSADLVATRARTSKGSGLQKALTLLKSQPAPGRFLDEDPRGKKLLDYLSGIATALDEERDIALNELGSLTKNIDHIKVIVSLQQTHAKAGGSIERTSLSSMLDDALKFNSASYDKHSVTVVREYGVSGELEIDRHKLFQIVMNLLSNGCYAVKDKASGGKLILRTKLMEDDQIAIEIEDNGMGISQENLTRIFNHGFTTKKTGHGFGLHASANAATEMGGRLQVHSEGVGRGACFTVIVPRWHKAGLRAA